MTRTGTEPGDYAEFDMDLLEAERRRHIRAELEKVKPTLEREFGVDLLIVNEGNELVLADAEGVRFRATTAPSGRLTVTDERGGELL